MFCIYLSSISGMFHVGLLCFAFVLQDKHVEIQTEQSYDAGIFLCDILRYREQNFLSSEKENIAEVSVIVIAAGGTKYLEFWKSHCLELHCLLFQLSRQDFEKLPSLATNTIVDWLSSSNMRMRMIVIIQYDEDDDDHLL